MSETLTPFSTARQMIDAMRSRQISAVELLAMHEARLTRYDGTLNSVVLKDLERARLDAAEADRKRARGEDLPLLGLPMTIKESIDVEGYPSTAGVPERVGHRAAADASTVRRLRVTGAVIFGKTNVCQWLADYTGDNPVYGRTSNPWDLSRTSGGSTAGSAALAAGLTPLEIGSDLGGSIRVPAAFCGLWGHKPSAGLVPNSGHFPGSDGPNPFSVMAAQGPHGRSPGDLEIALDVVAGPEIGNDVAWRVELPPARHRSLRDYRVAVLPEVDWLPVDPEIRSALSAATDAIRQSGATVAEVNPGFGDFREHYGMFRSLMAAIVSVRWTPEYRARVLEDKRSRPDPFCRDEAAGIESSAAQYFLWMEKREKYRGIWRRFFEDWDLLLTPATLVPAFEHTRIPTADRRLTIDGREIEFDYMSFYPSVATLAGLPATALPAGKTQTGLPIGLQAIGPLFEDRTTLQFASLLSEVLEGPFEAPPGYV